MSQHSLSLDDLRRAARRLHRAYDTGQAWALQRVSQDRPRSEGAALKRADFLHLIARENGFASWPALKLAAETTGLDRATGQLRLRGALFWGNAPLVRHLLTEMPDLAQDDFGLLCALYDRGAVQEALSRDPELALRAIGPRRPILHVSFSRWIKTHPELEPDMLAVAEMLVEHGADVNDGYPAHEGDDHMLSALYGAIGHADNMALGRWLLAHGANANDGESLYHATELGHHEGLRMLLEADADPRGTNALLRAMDFNDHVAVEFMLAHGAKADDYNDEEVGGEQPWVVPALHQAARRGCDQRMVSLLLDAGADPARVYKGANAYAFSRVHGNRAVSDAMDARDAGQPLSEEEQLLALASEGPVPETASVDPARLPEAYRHLIREILHLPGRLPHIKRLVALGLPFDHPDDMGLTPLQIAGWEGLPDVMEWILTLGPDLTHVNAYGGTLISTILHGSENAPDAAMRDHPACLQLVLQTGICVQRREIAGAMREDMRATLEDWAAERPDCVV
jgi:ankyrin repeat protein